MSDYYKVVDGKWIHITSIEDVCNELKQVVSDAIESKEKAEKELAEIKDRKWKNLKLQEMKSQLESIKKDSDRGFSITEEEETAIEEWRTNHLKEQHMLNDINEKEKFNLVGTGASFEYLFTPTSIGVLGEIRCRGCLLKAQNHLKQKYKNALEKNEDIFLQHGEFQELCKQYDAKFVFKDLK